MLIFGHEDVRKVLDGREEQVVEIIRRAYVLHAAGHSSVPHSSFLRFPGEQRNRIIALPAYLGGEEEVAGVKWIASFPDNLRAGLQRASAVIVLNSVRTGRPEALLEGSVISARRTGASAALAAGLLASEQPKDGVLLIGCGVINFEVLRFLRISMPSITSVTLCDIDTARMRDFGARCARSWPELAVDTAANASDALAQHSLVSIATTALRPHLDSRGCQPGTLALHISLRDLTPQAILASRNVVDDPDHVCREQTSLHLAEQLTGNRGFIHGTIGELLAGPTAGCDPHKVTVFSPFGLGILDMALAQLVCAVGRQEGLGTQVAGLLP